MDLNETYVYSSEEAKDTKDREIVRTVDVPTEERFTINQLEAKIVRIEEQKASLDTEIAKIQAKIDEATTALEIADTDTETLIIN